MPDIEQSIAEVLRLDAEATRGPWRNCAGYLTTRDPDGRSFGMSIWHIDEMGQAHASAPFQAVPFARTADATLIAYYRTAAPALAREVQRLLREWQGMSIRRELIRLFRPDGLKDGLTFAKALDMSLGVALERCCDAEERAEAAEAEVSAAHRAGQEAMRERAEALCRARAERYAEQVEKREPGSGGRIVADARSAEAEACADAILALEVE